MDNAEIMEKSSIDVENIRADFPVLSKQIGGRPLIYLDNGATTQKPQAVIDRVSQFDSEEYGTVRRGSYRLCERSTQLYEEVRKVAFLVRRRNRRLSSPVAPPSRSISWPMVLGVNLSMPGMRSSFLISSTMPIRCRGRYCARRRVQSLRLFLLMTTAN